MIGKTSGSVTTSPKGNTSRKSPLTPFLYSPMRNLRLSERTSPVPPSPNRKRQNTFRKQSFSFCDFSHELSDNSDEFDTKNTNLPKHGRFTCKSESHTNKQEPIEKASFIFGPQQYAESQVTSRVRKESSSLPCSPSHAMPAKWRFKQRQREEKDVSSLTPTSAVASDSGPLKNQHGTYNDTIFFRESRDKDVQAYQSNDQLIVIADDRTHEPGEEMEVIEAKKVSSSGENYEKNKSIMKAFPSSSDEMRDVNMSTCDLVDSVMLPIEDEDLNERTSNSATRLTNESQETGKNGAFTTLKISSFVLNVKQTTYAVNIDLSIMWWRVSAFCFLCQLYIYFVLQIQTTTFRTLHSS